MEKYIFLQSSDSKTTSFPGNTRYHFRVKLTQRLTFDGFWVVSLMELNFGKLDMSKVKDPYVDVLCNLCDSSLVGETQLSLLRRIDLRQGPTYSFGTEMCMRVKLKETDNIELYLRSDNPDPASFLSEETHATLHLRRYPFVD